MVLSFKERRLRETMKKEQKRSERLGVQTAQTGESIVQALGKGRKIGPEDLKKMKFAVSQFQIDGEFHDVLMEKLKLQHKALYKIVQEEFESEWMNQFMKLVDHIPAASRFRPFAISWPQWLQFGMEVDMNEEDVVNALKVMLIFRDR